MRGLDAWITGHWGEDQFRNEPPEIEDEGAMMCQSARDYLDIQSKNGYEDEFYSLTDAIDILEVARDQCLRQYECRFCGKPTGKKDTYCGPKCYKADAEGL